MSFLFRRSCVCSLSLLLSWWSQLHPTQRRRRTLTDIHPLHTLPPTSVTTMQVNRVSLNVCFFLIGFCSLLYFWLHCHCLFFSFSDMFIHLSDVEGYMKTDDRMRLAKERREERERSLGRWCPCIFFFLQSFYYGIFPSTVSIIGCGSAWLASRRFILSSLSFWCDKLSHFREHDSTVE